jgi:hypothetical protein
METIYKLRHRKSGLFYNPMYYSCKLDTKGKIYLKRPVLGKIGPAIRVTAALAKEYNLELQESISGYPMLKVVYADWEVCEFAVILSQIFDCPQPIKKEQPIEEDEEDINSTFYTDPIHPNYDLLEAWMNLIVK